MEDLDLWNKEVLHLVLNFSLQKDKNSPKNNFERLKNAVEMKIRSEL